MALQLRFNLLSGKDIALPFGCIANRVSSPDIIFKKYLDDARRAVERGGHILFSDMKEIFGDDDDGEDEEVFVLDIYVTTIE